MLLQLLTHASFIISIDYQVIAINQMLLTTGVIIIYVLSPVIVMDEFLLTIVVHITPVYNPCLFHSLDLIIKLLLRTNCCLQ